MTELKYRDGGRYILIKRKLRSGYINFRQRKFKSKKQDKEGIT